MRTLFTTPPQSRPSAPSPLPRAPFDPLLPLRASASQPRFAAQPTPPFELPAAPLTARIAPLNPPISSSLIATLQKTGIAVSHRKQTTEPFSDRNTLRLSRFSVSCRFWGVPSFVPPARRAKESAQGHQDQALPPVSSLLARAATIPAGCVARVTWRSDPRHIHPTSHAVRR